MGSLKPRTGYSPTRSRSKSLATKSANARDSSTVVPNCLVRVSRREAMLTAGPMTVKSSRVRDPMLPYMTSDVDADAVIQRRTTGFAVLFVQDNHGLTGFGHGMQQI